MNRKITGVEFKNWAGVLEILYFPSLEKMPEGNEKDKKRTSTTTNPRNTKWEQATVNYAKQEGAKKSNILGCWGLGIIGLFGLGVMIIRKSKRGKF